MKALKNFEARKTASAEIKAILEILSLSAAILLFVWWPAFRVFVFRHPGLIGVLIAVAGEVYFDWEETIGKKAAWKKFFMSLLVVSLAYEIYEASESDQAAGNAIQLAGEANERAALVESNNLVLQTNVNATKIELANAETRLNQSVKQLQDITSPMDIGNVDSLGEELGAMSGIGVEIRTSTDANAQHAADDLEGAFFVARWPKLNRNFIGDIGDQGIVIGYNGDDNSVKAAKLLCKALIERNIPAQIFIPFRVRNVPTNSIIVAVMQRPDETNSKIIISDSKTQIDQDEISNIQPEIFKLMGEKFPIGSKELADAQARFDSLAAQYKSLNEDLSENENELSTLDEAQRRAEEGTNWNKPGFHLNNVTSFGAYNFWSGQKPSNLVVEVHNAHINPEILQ